MDTDAQIRFVILVEFLRSDGNFSELDTRDPRYDFSEVEVLATDENEAHIIAAQMVACRDNVLVTRTIRSL